MEVGMTKIEPYEFPDELYYTKDHVWVKVEGNTATIGFSQLGQDMAGSILFVEAPRAGREIAKDEAFMSMESGKWVGRVKAPISGKILESNQDLEWECSLVNSDPYGKGWLCKIELKDPKELESLLRANTPEFADLVAAERKKYNK
jgi:glycine cleavage system H protein